MLNLPRSYRLTVRDIQLIVAGTFGLPVREMKSAARTRNVARPRQIAMYLARRHTPRSLPEIGCYFGHRDHTTVLHAIRSIERLRTEDADLDQSVKIAESMIALAELANGQDYKDSLIAASYGCGE